MMAPSDFKVKTVIFAQLGMLYRGGIGRRHDKREVHFSPGSPSLNAELELDIGFSKKCPLRRATPLSIRVDDDVILQK